MGPAHRLPSPAAVVLVDPTGYEWVPHECDGEWWADDGSASHTGEYNVEFSYHQPVKSSPIARHSSVEALEPALAVFNSGRSVVVCRLLKHHDWIPNEETLAWGRTIVVDAALQHVEHFKPCPCDALSLWRPFPVTEHFLRYMQVIYHWSNRPIGSFMEPAEIPRMVSRFTFFAVRYVEVLTWEGATVKRAHLRREASTFDRLGSTVGILPSTHRIAGCIHECHHSFIHSSS